MKVLLSFYELCDNVLYRRGRCLCVQVDEGGTNGETVTVQLHGNDRITDEVGILRKELKTLFQQKTKSRVER